MLQEVIRAGNGAFKRTQKDVFGVRCLRGVQRSAAAALVALVCALLCFDGSARAAARSVAVTVKIPVTCQATGLEEVVFTARLRPNEDGAAPMEMRLRNKEQKEFVLDFDEPGEYYFTIQQLEGEDARIVYDKSCYWLHASVTRNADGLTVSTVLWKDGSTEKRTQVKFINRLQGSAGENPDEDDANNGGTGGDDNDGNDGNGSGGSGNDGNDNNTGDGNGSGTGSDGSGSAGNGSGSGSSGGSSFWGNGSFWGSSSSNASSGSSLVNTLVRTGDQAQAMLWGALLVLALAVAAGAWRYQRNRERKTNRKDREDG